MIVQPAQGLTTGQCGARAHTKPLGSKPSFVLVSEVESYEGVDFSGNTQIKVLSSASLCRFFSAATTA